MSSNDGLRLPLMARAASPLLTLGTPSARQRFKTSPSPVGGEVPDLVIAHHASAPASSEEIEAVRKKYSRSPSPVTAVSGRLSRGPSPAATENYLDLLNIPGSVTFDRTRGYGSADRADLNEAAKDLIDSVRRSRTPSPILDISRTEMLPMPKHYRIRSAAALQEVAAQEAAAAAAAGARPSRASGALSPLRVPTIPSPRRDTGAALLPSAQLSAGAQKSLKTQKLQELTPVELRKVSRVLMLSSKFTCTHACVLLCSGLMCVRCSNGRGGNHDRAAVQDGMRRSRIKSE
jgi:hypothetical protein